MQVTTTTFTIAEYCSQMSRDEIIVNPDYQRSHKVWPPAARSYLIDTVLMRFPIPKLTLYQHTDLRSRKTIKEIVDGQQRSQALFNFLNGRYRLSPRSPNAGKRFSQLDEADQQAYLEYGLSADVLVAATETEIRQLFRRINSYNVPLNDPETRHAVFQGAFKWFVVDLTDQYAQTLKTMGVFGERQLTRMGDAQLLSEITRAMLQGIVTSQSSDLDELYRTHEAAFDERDALQSRFDRVFERLMTWVDFHKGPLMRPYNFYSLFLAIAHLLDPIPALQETFPLDGPVDLDNGRFVANLGTLGEVLEEPETFPSFLPFVEAASQATNVGTQRAARFVWFCRAAQESFSG